MIPTALTDGSGMVGVLAIDHRDSLRAVIAPLDPPSVPRRTIVELKRAVIEELADAATGVMLEPEYSIPDLVDALPAGCGFTAALESQGYSTDPAHTPTEILDGWGAMQARQSGASAAKLLAYYSPDAPAHAAAQRRVIAETVEQCAAAGLPLFLEPLAFPGAEVGPATLAAVRGTAHLGADVLKVAWPGRDHLDGLAEAVGDRPWVLLSGGGPFDEYLDQVRAAVAVGCSGFMAGRAVWREVTQAEPPERARVLRDVCRPRLERLREVL